MPGKVYLVGAGPGDPGLITVKALKLIEKADVLIYDQLANSEFLKKVKSGCELLDVGKTAGNHPVPQPEINWLLVEKAKVNSVVVRLKGGDPFVFGRGGEEGEYLTENNILFEVVPGISSSIAVPAYAGIPVTHRQTASSFAVITGHEDINKEESSIDWNEMAHGADTLVILMGMGNLEPIVGQLLKAHLDPGKPVALIEKGTTPSQRTLTGVLSNIVELSQFHGIKPPAIIVVGEVVLKRNKLNWYENLPLFGKVIWVTRSRTQSSQLVQLLQALGARVFEVPTIQIDPPDEATSLEEAVMNLPKYHWLVFTSANGVQKFFECLLKIGKDARQLGSVKIATIGPATADKLGEYFIKPDLMPVDYVAESLVDAFHGIPLNSKAVLIVRAQEARDTLPQGLSAMGAQVDIIPAYKTVIPEQSEVMDKITSGEIPIPDLVTFTSSSTVANFVKILPETLLVQIKRKSQFVSIGPITSQAAENLGINISMEAEVYTIPGLVEAIQKMCSPR